MRKVVIGLLFVSYLFGRCELFDLKTSSKGITLKEVLADLSFECDISIVFEDKVARAKINKRLEFVNFQNYTLSQFLDLILGENNLFYSFDPSLKVLKISYYKTQTFPIDYLNLSSMVSESKKSIILGSQANSLQNQQKGGEASDYTTISARSEFTFWESLKEQLKALLIGVEKDKPKIFINKDASLITISGTKRQLQEAKKFLTQLQTRMHQQVLIEAKLLEVVYNDSKNVGIDWSKLGLSLQASRDAHSLRKDGVEISNFSLPNYFIGYNFSAEGILDFLRKYGKVNLLSNPKILTLNNQPAIINVGDKISYKYETSGYTLPTSNGTLQQSSTYAIGQSFVGITLYVIPEITQTGEIIMKINPVTSELLNPNFLKDRSLPPDMKIKQLTSIVKVKDGQKVLIGGLISKKIVKEDKKVPLLGDMPVIGRVFHSSKKATQRSELFILISPKIIKDTTSKPY